MQLKQEIEQLKNELKGLAEVCDRCTALTNEVSSLHWDLNTITKEPATSSATKSATKQPKYSYTRVASTLRASSSLPAPNASKNSAAHPTEAIQVQATGESIKSALPGQRKIKVDGARRIWNTMPTCSARTVATTISKVIPTKLDLQVKCKTKRLANKTVVYFAWQWRWPITPGSKLVKSTTSNALITPELLHV